MKLSEFNKLQKMMALTFSESDGEALTAIRKANAVLKAHNLNWDAVFKRLVSVEVEEAPDIEPAVDERGYKKDPALDEAFQVLIDTVPHNTGFRSFVLDLHEQWTNKHFLTEVQRNAIMRSARRNKGKQ